VTGRYVPVRKRRVSHARGKGITSDLVAELGRGDCNPAHHIVALEKLRRQLVWSREHSAKTDAGDVEMHRETQVSLKG